MNYIILKNCKFLIAKGTKDGITTGKSVLIEGKIIKAIDEITEIKKQYPESANAEIIDCSNKIVMPGLVDGHNHLCNTHMNLCRSLAPVDYSDIIGHMLGTIHGPYGWLTEEANYTISTASILNDVKFGATTIENSSILPDSGYRAMKDFKIRGILAPQIQTGVRLDADNLNWSQAIDKARYCLEHYHKPNDLMKVVVHPHDVYDCTDKFLREAYELAESYDTNFVTHFWEFPSTVAKSDVAWAKDGGGFEHYKKLGIITDRSVFFHGTALSEEEIEYLASVGTSVIHNPDINAANCGTCAYVPKMIQAGLNVGVGSDYGSLSVLTGMKLMQEVHQIMPRELKKLEYETPFYCATIGSAKAYQMDHMIGSIEVGKRADVITIDLKRASHLLPMSTAVIDIQPELLFFLFVRNCPGTETSETIIDGTFIRKGGEFVSIDEEKILADAFELCDQSLKDISEAKKAGKYYARIMHDDYITDEALPEDVLQ